MKDIEKAAIENLAELALDAWATLDHNEHEEFVARLHAAIYAAKAVMEDKPLVFCEYCEKPTHKTMKDVTGVHHGTYCPLCAQQLQELVDTANGVIK